MCENFRKQLIFLKMKQVDAILLYGQLLSRRNLPHEGGRSAVKGAFDQVYILLSNRDL